MLFYANPLGVARRRIKGVVMTDLKDLELKPFNLAGVPSELEWCVYPEERERGEVFLPETAYRLVLALRWILAYTSWGYEENFETWRVYWKNEDKYGFNIRIFLFREKVEQYTYDDELEVMQPQTWVELAKLSGNGNGVIEEVYVPAPQPYDGEYAWRLDGAAGVRRLLEDAMVASRATHNFYPIQRDSDWTSTYRIDGEQDGDGWILSFKLEADHKYVQTYVTGISLEFREGRR